MNRAKSQRGEMMIESLISMLIIAMTSMMLMMGIAAAMRSNAQAVRTTTFLNEAAESESVAEDVKIKIDEQEIGKVDVKRQGGLYYYESATTGP